MMKMFLGMVPIKMAIKCHQEFTFTCLKLESNMTGKELSKKGLNHSVKIDC